ncbi:hypothetical protein O5621_13945 [Escherichia coli]|nr:hypothetical protein [Escherichia coli]
MFDVSLLNLPWATLVTLTSGYIGYFIANVGLKDHHKPIEVTFSSLIFGLTAMMAYQAVMWAGLNARLATLTSTSVCRYMRCVVAQVRSQMDVQITVE